MSSPMLLFSDDDEWLAEQGSVHDSLDGVQTSEPHTVPSDSADDDEEDHLLTFDPSATSLTLSAPRSPSWASLLSESDHELVQERQEHASETESLWSWAPPSQGSQRAASPQQEELSLSGFFRTSQDLPQNEELCPIAQTPPSQSSAVTAAAAMAIASQEQQCQQKEEDELCPFGQHQSAAAAAALTMPTMPPLPPPQQDALPSSPPPNLDVTRSETTKTVNGTSYPYLLALRGQTFDSPADKRQAVVSALTNLTLQVLLQLAHRTEQLLPPQANASRESDAESAKASSSSSSSEEETESGGHTTNTTNSISRKRKRARQRPSRPSLFTPKRVDPLQIELVHRSHDCASAPSSAISKRRHLHFPRRSRASTSTTAGSVSAASASGFGSAELACLLRVVALVLRNLNSTTPTLQTKRDLFYADVRLFRTQRTVDVLVDDLAAALGCRRFDLGVVASAKGLVFGPCRMHLETGHVLDAHQTPQLIPPKETIGHLQAEACRALLVVEKEAVFQTLKDQAAALPLGTLLVCGKGQPDMATRGLVCMLSTALPPSIPLLALVDHDPHGISIFSTYKNGSAAMAFDEAQLATPRLTLLHYHDVLDPAQLERHLLPLTSADRKKALSMVTQSARSDVLMLAQLSRMLHGGFKAEIEALHNLEGGLTAFIAQRVSDAIEHCGF